MRRITTMLAAGFCLLPGNANAITPVGGGASTKTTYVDHCAEASADAALYVSKDWKPTSSSPSHEAAYYYRPGCRRWITDVFLAEYSHQCDKPNSYGSCGISLSAMGYDVPATQTKWADNFYKPLVQRDCDTYHLDADIYVQEVGQVLLSYIGQIRRKGEWYGGTCNLIDYGSIIGSYENQYPSGGGWDRFRVAARLRVRGSGQQVAAVVLPTTPN